MTPPITFTETEARDLGYVSITTPYEVSEKVFFERALESLRTTDYVVVLDRLKRPEIFRKKSELKLIND